MGLGLALGVTRLATVEVMSVEGVGVAGAGCPTRHSPFIFTYTNCIQNTYPYTGSHTTPAPGFKTHLALQRDFVVFFLFKKFIHIHAYSEETDTTIDLQ